MSAEEHWKKIIKHEQEAKLDNLKQHIANMAKAAANMAREAADALQAAAAMEDALDPLGWSERDAKIREQDYWFWREGAGDGRTCSHCGSSSSWRDDGEDGCFCGDGEC